MRKQILSLAIAGLLTIFFPGAVYPLGLGKIEVKSRLNQPLRAEIILRGVHQIPLKDIKVTLASSEAFSQAGLNRALVLSALRFHTLRKKTGETVVKVTSQNPIREPFLRFLVTVTWPQGQLLREYVVLLDPPFPLQKQEFFFIKTTAVDEQSKGELAGSNVLNGIIQAKRPATEDATASSTIEGAISTYGPTAPTDTLWQIAQRLQSSRPSITLQQMMLALQKVNPEAFFYNNINALKSKAVLKIPMKEGVLKRISPAEATHQVRQQNQAWAALAGKQGKLERQTEEDGSKRSSVLRAEGETDILVAQGQDSLSLGAVPGATKSNDAIVHLKIQLSRVRETLATQMEESEKTQTRLREIALQIKTLRQRLPARDSLLTGLWGLSKEQREALDLVNALAALSVKNSQVSILPSPVATEFSSSLLETTEKELDGGATILSTVMSLRNLALFCGSGALFLALVIWRRRKHKIAERLALVEAEQKRSRRELAGVLGKRADLEVVKISGEQPISLVAVQMAEESLAANRYHEAATILKAILKKNPERQDLRLRLAKVYYALNNGSEFVAFIEEWAPNQNENNAVWAELVAMGRILSPNHPWFVSSQRNDEETYQEPESVSSDRSLPLDPPSFIFGEETAEVFSSTGELALKVEISGAEDEVLNIDRERMDRAEQGTQTDEQGRKEDGLGNLSSPSEEEEAPRKSLELSLLELDSTQESNVLMWAPETGANDLEEAISAITHLAKRGAVDESGTEKIGVSCPGEALMNDLDEVEIKLNRNDTEGACDILEEVITAGNEKQ